MRAQSIQFPPGELPTQPPLPQADGAEGELHALPANRASSPPFSPPRAQGTAKAGEGRQKKQ